MSSCPTCGGILPEEKDVRFCPNCGAYIYDSIKKAKIWSCTLRTRVIVFFVVLFICFMVTVSGALTRVNFAEALSIKRNVENLEVAVKVAGVQVIFGNNFMHTLVMFIPVVGSGWGFFVLYNTGRVFAAIATIVRENPLFLLSLVFLQPFAWMEYISYALAISESFILTYSMIKRSFKNELKNMSMILTICSVILLLAAIMEFAVVAIQLR